MYKNSTLQRLTFPEILHRLALPFFIFSAVLLSLLGLSWYLLIPSIAQVEISGVVRDVSELRSYYDSLKASASSLEDDRDDFLNPVRNQAYQELRDQKASARSLLAVRQEMQRLAAEAVPEKRTAVSIASFSYDASAGTVKLRGRVQHVGPRSMTVLAQFIEDLRSASFTESVSNSQFTREEDANGIYSPFQISITLL